MTAAMTAESPVALIASALAWIGQPTLRVGGSVAMNETGALKTFKKKSKSH